MEPSDRELMGRLARGEREALAPLVERHQRRLHRIALSYLRNADEALDAVQETFVKAFQAAGRWNPDSEVGPWLTRIAVNHCIDRYRWSRRRQRTETPLPTEMSDHDPHLQLDEPSPERRVLGRELGERIGAALRSLPARQRAVFLLRHREEMTLEDIARTLDLSLGTVKSSLHRAVHRLRERLVGLGGMSS
jgi:RNA polymerase sigma factor (sigma-70 family)